MLRKVIIFLVVLFVSNLIIAQSNLVIDQTMSPKQLIENVLAGDGVEISNVKYNGNATFANSVKVNVSKFNAEGTSLPIKKGILLSTGNGQVAIGPNNSAVKSDNTGTNVVSDPDLDSIATGNVTNGVDLEFDFVPSGDTVEFKYIFASEEYPDNYISTGGSNFYDAFGFFISGPGINGNFENNGINIATLNDGVTAVTIENVNPNTNNAYYVEPFDNTHFQYDARTILMTAKAAVQCGETYHIKLVIANVNDQALDSGVFLEANSFKSGVINVSVNTVTGDTTIVEGCGEAEIFLSRSLENSDSSLSIFYTIEGTATNGTDFDALDNTITFQPGEDTVSFKLNPIKDQLNEGVESVIFTVYTINQCGDTVTSVGKLYILDEPNFKITTKDTTINCPNDSIFNGITVSGGHTPYKYEWLENGANTDSAYFDGTKKGDTWYTVKITDKCDFEKLDSFKITLNQLFEIDTIIKKDSECTTTDEGTGFVSTTMNPIDHSYKYKWINQSKTDSIEASVWTKLSPGWYFFSAEFEGCTIKDSIQILPLDPPVAKYTATPTSGVAPLTVVFDNQSENATSYNWNLAITSFTVNNLSSQQATYTQEGEYVTSLVVSNDKGCVDSMSIVISVIRVDSIKLIRPNVFTPNGDGVNDVFDMKIENFNDFKVEIRNRWGNKITTLTPSNATWDGNTKSGIPVKEGTYFYSYEIIPTHSSLEKLTGNGFVDVLRKK